ncbi:hypothetical protein ACFLZB_00955 [Nanoarchaeota archaeon]
MRLDYHLLDESHQPSPAIEERILSDLRFLHYRSLEGKNIEDGMPLYLVDLAGFESLGSHGAAKIMSYFPGEDKVYSTDGTLWGHVELPKPMGELTREDLAKLSKKGQLFLKLDMLQRLQELVDQ